MRFSSSLVCVTQHDTREARLITHFSWFLLVNCLLYVHYSCDCEYCDNKTLLNIKNFQVHCTIHRCINGLKWECGECGEIQNLSWKSALKIASRYNFHFHSKYIVNNFIYKLGTINFPLYNIFDACLWKENLFELCFVMLRTKNDEKFAYHRRIVVLLIFHYSKMFAEI